jgi:hypothetical protein
MNIKDLLKEIVFKKLEVILLKNNIVRGFTQVLIASENKN